MVTTSIDVVLPVLNEEEDLSLSVDELRSFLRRSMGEYDWRVVIADNGSTDATPEIARRLTESHPDVAYLRLEERGRGRALRKAWLDSRADIVAYMDVDLSTELAFLPVLVRAVDQEGYDLAIGSRLKKGARVIGRPPKRELMSRAYSLMFRGMFATGFRDAQCGFKVLSRRAAVDLAPLVRDNGWFFDTELLILAERLGYRIREVPVKWTDDPGSRVRIVRTAYEDVKGLLRLRFGGIDRARKSLARRQPKDK